MDQPQSYTNQDTSLAIPYDYACLRLFMTFTLALLNCSGINFLEKYLHLERVYDLIDVLLHVCCVACDNVASRRL